MIVLDEQLLGRNIEQEITKWYRGKVVSINELRPNSVIKDDAIPFLLRQQSQPTFVTINEKDFWQKVDIDNRFCVICFAWSDSRVREIASSLRQVLRLSELTTKAKRMGRVIRVTDDRIGYYLYYDRRVRTLT